MRVADQTYISFLLFSIFSLLDERYYVLFNHSGPKSRASTRSPVNATTRPAGPVKKSTLPASALPSLELGPRQFSRFQ